MNNKLVFLGAESNYKESDICIFGAPMDTTTTNRPGTRFGPQQARLESYGLEEYSPYVMHELFEYKISDYGDLELTFGDSEKQLRQISSLTAKISNDNKIPLMIGGEHLVTLGSINGLVELYDSIHIIQFDAHTDLRSEYMGVKLSHSTVMYHCGNIEQVKSVNQFGIRSGLREEFIYAQENNFIEKFSVKQVKEIVHNLKNENVYVTIDLDVLDPSIFSGTGTPEPGGITFNELMDALLELRKLNNIIGCDVVELSPQYDSSGVSNAVCAKVIREMLLIIGGIENERT